MGNEVFENLFAVNVNEHVETKNTGKTSLKYLSWAWAWAEVKKHYPDASYEIVKFDKGLPYSYDPVTGYMCYTRVTIQGITHEMWLPVMDSHNEAMLDKPRVVKTKYSEYTVPACTMFDVNKTVMRCLTKNLAMFGLGLYIYAGEDLPEEPIQPETEEVKELKMALEGFISNGVLDNNPDYKRKAEWLLSHNDIKGLTKCIEYCNSVA